MALIKKPEEISLMRAAGKILARTLRELAAQAAEGVTLRDLDDLARGLIKKEGGEPAFLNYQPHGATKPYPATICASLNEVVVHGVPTRRRLTNGDLLKIDLGVRYGGYCADAAMSVGIGETDPGVQKLIRITREALDKGIAAVKPGAHLGDIGFAISHAVAPHGFSLVKGLTGHGIGRNLHEDPEIENEGEIGKGMRLAAGMTLAIEPMVSAGSSRIVQLRDESYATDDGSLSVHFEHTVVVTPNGAEILTQL